MGTLAQLLDRSSKSSSPLLFHHQAFDSTSNKLKKLAHSKNDITFSHLDDLSSSPPSPISSVHANQQEQEQQIAEEDGEEDEEFELVYKRPDRHHNRKKDQIRVRDNHLQKIISRITTGRVGMPSKEEESTTPTTTCYIRKPDLTTNTTTKSSSYLLEKETFNDPGFGSSSTPTLPGSRLSLIATSLPHPKMVNVAHLIHNSHSSSSQGTASNKNAGAIADYGNRRKTKTIKPLPALSPITTGSETRMYRKAIKSDNRKRGSTTSPVIINVTSGSSPPPMNYSAAMSPSQPVTLTSVAVFSPSESSLPVQKDEKTLVQGMMQPGKKNQNKIKRPLNAFMVWSKLQRRKIMDNDPTVHHSLISKQLGAGWKALSEEERQPYYKEAKRLGEIHNQIYPDYKYQPRRKDRIRPQMSSSSVSPTSPPIISSKNLRPIRPHSQSPDLPHYSLNFYTPVNTKKTTAICVEVIQDEFDDDEDTCLDLSMKSKRSLSHEDDFSSEFQKMPLTSNDDRVTVTGVSKSFSGSKKWAEIFDDATDKSDDDEDKLFIDE